jgi:integrase/recombinase XerD
MTVVELNARLDSYLAVRSALGFRLQAERTLLRSFIQFLDSRAELHPIRAQMAVEWACSSSTTRGGAGQAVRLSMARKFLLHLRATVPETEIPDRGLITYARRPRPYIFSEEEIERLIASALTCGPADSLRRYTLATVIGMLAATGLRVGEALRLKDEEVKLDELPARLVIRDTKFHKSRIVPLHATVAGMLRRYSNERKRLQYPLSEAFFVSEKGEHLNHNTLWRWFARLTKKLGMWPSSGRRPCLHCMRHSFAVRRMLAWYREGADVQALLPTLSVYLGHVRPQESYWYLTATPNCSVPRRSDSGCTLHRLGASDEAPRRSDRAAFAGVLLRTPLQPQAGKPANNRELS